MIPPRRIVRRHPDDQLMDLDEHPAWSGAPCVRPFARDQLAVPPKQGIGRRDRRNLPQGCAAETVCSAGQPAAVVIRETPTTSTELTRNRRFSNEVRDGLALLTVQPADQRTQYDLQRSEVDHERSLYHGCPEGCRSSAGTRRVGLGFGNGGLGGNFGARFLRHLASAYPSPHSSRDSTCRFPARSPNRIRRSSANAQHFAFKSHVNVVAI
jgi:hypothetical protein